MKAILALQDEITLRITQALQIKLTEGEQARIYGKGTDNLDAYLKWLQGQDLLIRGNKDDNALARRMFEEVIRSESEAAAYEVLRIDPEFSVQDYAKTLPCKEKTDLNCVIDALRKAGLPE